MSGPGRPGLFGKLPAHGDFVARGLEPRARGMWDAFLSAGLTRAQHRLGERFEAAHDAAPAWCFVLGPHAPGDGWTAGAFAPSMDRAGRRFAIAVLIGGLDGDGARLQATAETMERVIFDALEAGADADGVVAMIAAAQAGLPEPQAGSAPQARWWTLGGFDHAPDGVVGDGFDPALVERAWAPAAMHA